jgi:hypothetical protein
MIHNKFDFTQQGGFPFTQDVLKNMQGAYSDLSDVIAKLAGDNAILSGCKITGSAPNLTISSGWVVADGKVLPFVGGTSANTKFTIVANNNFGYMYENGEEKYPYSETRCVLNVAGQYDLIQFYDLLRLAEIKAYVEDRYTPPTIKLVGLEWDVENLQGYYNFNEFQEVASSVGRRAPTQPEFQQLINLPKVWDATGKGYWFAENSMYLKNPNKSLFLPAAGSFHLSDLNTLISTGTYGQYVSASESGSVGVYALQFNSTSLGIAGHPKGVRMSLRCVKW